MDLTKEKWEARWKRLCQDALQSGVHVLECSPRRLRVSAQDSQYSYPNPAPYFYEERITISPPTLYGIVHGHLDGDSVLVDRAGNTWVIDFTMTGRAPLLMDYVSLENAVKFDILPTLSLVERHEIERRLLDMEDLYDQQGEEGLSLAAKKAFQVIVRIRNRAADVMGEKLKPYLVALIFSTLERFSEYCPDLRYTKQETTLFSHMLLVMGMITQNLFGWEDRLQELPCQAETSLWLDEAHQEVWVEGRCIALAPQRFKLLKYLYDHANQPCNREELASQVYEMDMESFLPPDRKRLEKDTINTNIGRLRKDIEPNPQYPKYIKTVRGVGYELVLPVVSGNGD
jgi:DNA-binding winged helix-turn-helix (wHTH) protein